jgi:hypothetical protein
MENVFKPLVQELLQELTVAVKAVMVAKAPSLKGSALVESVEFKETSNGFVMWANDYYDYVDRGRKPMTKKVPISALIQFIKKRSIKGRGRSGRFITNNQLAFAIQTSIFKRGIKGKLFDQAVSETIDEVSDIIFDQKALDAMTVELDLYFND